MPLGAKLNDILEVFIYFDSEDNIIATTLQPYAQLGCFDFLKVVDVNRSNGFLPLHDKSSSQDIMRVFSDSKRSFKNAIGQLYKQRKIVIEPDGIRLQL